MNLPALPAELAGALVDAQIAAPAALGKVDYNDFAKFDYVAADRMIMAGREALTSCGLVLVPLAAEIKPAVGDCAGVLRTEYELIHRSGQSVSVIFESPIVTKKGTPADKAGFGAATESLGYAYRGVLSIGRLDPREIADVSSRDDRTYQPAPAPAPIGAPKYNAPPADTDLADQFAASIRKFAADGNLDELQRLPKAISGVQLDGAAKQDLIALYNSNVIPLRALRGVAITDADRSRVVVELMVPDLRSSWGAA